MANFLAKTRDIRQNRKEVFHPGKVSKRSEERRKYKLTSTPPKTCTSMYFFHRTFLKARLTLLSLFLFFLTPYL